MDNIELNTLGWNPLSTKEEIENLLDLYCDFNQAILVDVKFFSADQVDFEMPGDTSEYSHCYVKFQSFDPKIADNKDRNEVVLHFVGVRQLMVISGKLNHGNLVGVNFSLNDDGSVCLELYNNDQDLDKGLENQTPPTFICADSVGWNYDYGDNMK